jgi:selenocysteine lyase/cysteine desulfurase
MADANVFLQTANFGLKPKPADVDPKVSAAVEEWRQARRSGDLKKSRAMYRKVEQARQQAEKARR